jgi:UrcA family protein
MGKTVVLLGSLLFASSSVFAQPAVVVTRGAAPFEVVSYADLNINSPSGQDRLVHRIRSAAEGICLENSKEQVKFYMERHECFSTALKNGLSQMDRAITANASGATLAGATLTVSAH